jgi:hypothetical protein
MRRLGAFLLMVPFVSAVTGCVNLHGTRPVSIHVTYRETDTPVVGALVEVDYSFNGYGLVHIFNLPKPESVKTDSQGFATVRLISDANHLAFHVNGNPFWITERLIRYGGNAESIATYNQPELDVHLSPGR